MPQRLAVFLQAATFRKARIASLACVGPIPLVHRPQMLPQLRLEPERRRANPATMRLPLLVHRRDVPVQIPALPERGAARLAHVVANLLMDHDDVHGQRGALREADVALLAAKGPALLVHGSDVLHHVPAAGEDRGALRAPGLPRGAGLLGLLDKIPPPPPSSEAGVGGDDTP
eukprot:CAMPEP_0184713108 /NCGR_PEP_ID=MMETSP0314-20130426/3529_1 /TAXON_ID=38298 /ORGANISM="Rhodella maculata, Strain CCMP 736" /LENGTH=172 /DNA_ID=CAMNT_0027175685 /DNA_START=673 /DNA_END=1188 /DNA_ORIENTATION=-